MLSDRRRLLLVAGVGYLLGSFPASDLVARRHDVDLCSVGDHNPGFWNLRSQIGTASALPALMGDIAKGVVAAGFGRRIGNPTLGAAAAMIGHAYPPGRRGGKGVATFIGTAAVLSPCSFLAATTATGAGLLTSIGFQRSVAAGFWVYPLAQARFDGLASAGRTGVLMTFIGFRFAIAAHANAASG